jgi:SAM-dependent methyltransferase
MLRRHCADLEVSEYFDDVEPGACVDGVRCENVEALTFADASFDLCTSTEVFEHVADDRAGFRELWRVLRPGGCTLFTVPLNVQGPTRERAERIDGRIVHHLPPEYHDDHLRGRGRVLAFRTYGLDIVDRLRDAGFREAHIDRSYCEAFFGFGRAVIVARR